MAKYNEKELADTSKFLSFVLRHKPEAIGIVLDREGWADIDKLILCAQKAGKRLTRALLDTVVATSDKKRFSYSSDGRCIRAVQGHSASQVAIAFIEKTPPQFLYHGTANRFLDAIKKQGLIAGGAPLRASLSDEATARESRGKTRFAGYLNRQSTGNGETRHPFLASGKRSLADINGCGRIS